VEITGPEMRSTLKSEFALFEENGIPTLQPRDVRCAVRFPLTLPVSLDRNGEWVPGITRNISASGVLFETDLPISVGESITFFMCMPRAILGTSQDVLVYCHGRVVRCSISHTLPQVAATIDDYRFVEDK
jgi:hypothetical protein